MSHNSNYPNLVMIIRHGEKPGDPGDDSSGGPHLSVLGSARAAALSSLFTPGSSAKPRDDQVQLVCDLTSSGSGGFQGTYGSSGLGGGSPRFPVPDFLFAAQSSKHSQRPFETITPLSQALGGLAIQTPYADDDYKEQAQAILNDPGTYGGKVVLICWHHGKAPHLAHALGVSKEPLKPWDPWKPTVFDLVFSITWDSSKTAKLDVSYQQLLYGDTPGSGDGAS